MQITSINFLSFIDVLSKSGKTKLFRYSINRNPQELVLDLSELPDNLSELIFYYNSNGKKRILVRLKQSDIPYNKYVFISHFNGVRKLYFEIKYNDGLIYNGSKKKHGLIIK